MTTLNVQAVITAVDRLTGPLAAMGAKVNSLQNRFSSAAGAAAGFGTAAGIAAGGLIYALTGGQKELDAALRQFQVVGNATDKHRMQMRGLADDLAVRLGIPQLDLIKGATEMLQAGLSTDDLMSGGKDGVTLLQSMGEAAKAAGEPIADMATDLVTLAKAFNKPWGNPEERAKAMRDLMGLALVAPRLSPDTPTGHIRALKEFGPIAAQLGMKPEEASALQNTLSSAGFRDQLGGMGLKSILQRMLNPTLKAQAQMSAAGFNFGRVFNNNIGAISPDQFMNAMETAGLDPTDARKVISKKLQEGIAKGASLDILKFKAEMSKDVTKALGIKAGDAYNKQVVKTVIDDIMAASGTGINTRAFLEELQKMPTAAFKDLAGLHHASKMAVLKFQESLRQYDRNLDYVNTHEGDAVGEGFAKKAQGWAFQLDRMGAAWQAFRDKMWDTGGAGAWTGIVESIGNAFVRLNSMEPSKLESLSRGLTGLAVGLAGLAAGSAGVWALARIGALLSGPLGPLLMAGGLAQALGVLDGHTAQTGLNGAIVGGQSDSSSLLSSLQQLQASATALIATFHELAGVNFDGGGIVSALGTIKKLIDDITAGMNSLNKYLKGEGGTFGLSDGSFMGMSLGDKGLVPGAIGAAKGFGAADANAASRGSLSFWDTFKAGMMPGSGPNAALGQAGQLGAAPQQPIGPITAKLEGSGTVTVNVKVEGPGQVTGVSASDDGKNIKLNTGGGMGDTNK